MKTPPWPAALLGGASALALITPAFAAPFTVPYSSDSTAAVRNAAARLDEPAMIEGADSRIYASYLQSFSALGVHYNDLLDHGSNCEMPALAGSVLECRASSPVHVWGQLAHQWRKANGDHATGAIRSRRITGLVGGDASIANSARVGVSAGHVNNAIRARKPGNRIDASGMQVGAYGVYDLGLFYAKAMASYSWYDGDAERYADAVGLHPGTTPGDLGGDPDVGMWSFGLHGGYRTSIGANSVLTPYLHFDHVSARLKSFTETGPEGAKLAVDGTRSRHSFVTGGVKWAIQLGGVVPETNLG